MPINNLIRLEPFTRADFQRLIHWVTDEEFMVLWSGVFFTFPVDERQLEASLAGTFGDHPVRKTYKAVMNIDNQVVGHIELNNIDYRNKAAMLSKVLVGEPKLRGKGVGEAMVNQLMRIAFEDLKLHRVDLRVFDFNHSAVNCYLRCGFQKEGLIRDFRKVGDQYWNSYIMSILEDEWRALNPALNPEA